jgi:hypothetical protein
MSVCTDGDGDGKQNTSQQVNTFLVIYQPHKLGRIIFVYSYVGKKMPQAASKATKLKKTTSGDLPMLVVVRIVLLMASPWSTNGILKRRRGTQKRRRGMYEYEILNTRRLVVCVYMAF